MLKKASFFVIFLLLCLLTFSAVGAQPPLPAVSAEAAVLIDWNSGRILYAHNPHLVKPMASTTKIMTAIIALERGVMNDEVVTSPKAANTGGSSIWLEEGEVKKLEELILGLMLRSGNDAAVAIAEHISGSVEAFAELMTQRARELGAMNTSFKNPHGLHHPDHYTTAYDFAIIAAHAMGIKDFRRIVATPSVTISWPGHPWNRILHNQNKLFNLYVGAEGIKTGWTTPAGRCFVGSAERGGRRIISVVLNAPDIWEDTVTLLNFGFENFTYETLLKEGQNLKSVVVIEGESGKAEAFAGEDFYYPLNTGEKDKVTYRFLVDEPLEAPLRKGERIGELEIYFERELVGVLDLVSGNDIKRNTLWNRMKSFFGRRE
ncbi:MAG: D-alanyl-D-alanine carboxypeptidase family protein [Bacillota bacterium]|nr:D-alanyl-D-alanine carboxypeptidase family protein [Bacillota bacterium]